MGGDRTAATQDTPDRDMSLMEPRLTRDDCYAHPSGDLHMRESLYIAQHESRASQRGKGTQSLGEGNGVSRIAES